MTRIFLIDFKAKREHLFHGKIHLCHLIFVGMIFQLVSCSSPIKADYAPFLNPQATVTGQTLQSNDFPKGTITFENKMQHIGSETFILYQVARCEIHLFGERDENEGYKRLYWIQYEGYLPKKLLPFPINLKPDSLTYDYSDEPYKLEIGNRQFYTSNSYHSIQKSEEYLTATNGPDDSDFAHVTRLLRKNGVNINADVLGVRMVYLNPSSEKELMIIYYEVMDDDELSFEKLESEGEESSLWIDTSKSLRERARNGLDVAFDEGE